MYVFFFSFFFFFLQKYEKLSLKSPQYGLLSGGLHTSTCIIGMFKYCGLIVLSVVVVVVALLFYFQGKHLRSCRDSQLT